MKTIFNKYEEKFWRNGLTERGAPLIGFRDAEIQWNKNDEKRVVLETVFEELDINAIIFSKPSQLYSDIIDSLSAVSDGSIRPVDCETRTFFHELPVIKSLDPDAIIASLKARKCVIIQGTGIIAYGTVSIEQAFITFSSVCFACFVKFFLDILIHVKKYFHQGTFKTVFENVIKQLPPLPIMDTTLKTGPFTNEADVLQAISEAGKLTVQKRLVDSFFGNISYLFNEKLYISQTGSSLDELDGCIDPCPIDGSSCVGITASSEYPAHFQVIKQTENRAVLHGHPLFSVILSMDCDKPCCEFEGQCHLKCPDNRSVCGIPIVPGEVGSGKFGLWHTVPDALKQNPGVIVYGHGLFTTGKEDFNEAFHHLLAIENACRKEYFNKIKRLSISQ
ncbi:MAG: class II aldolase/adducin family protein [Desulfobacterales bacterium]|nr:class II aldolase/adducin family protein [Desulfobacterales bacterium]